MRDCCCWLWGVSLWKPLGVFKTLRRSLGEPLSMLGIVVNGATALLFMRGRHGDLNIRGAYLHMVADAGVSFGVVVAALLIMWTGWLWMDPAVSLGIAAVVLASGWGWARDSVNLALDGVPKGIDLAKVESYLRTRDGVIE